MDNDTLDTYEPQPRRSSILKPPAKRISRDSRTVSFNDRCLYKELHRDGTSDITHVFVCDDMDITMMETVEPRFEECHSSMDISTDGSVIVDQFIKTLPKVNSTDKANIGYDSSTMYEKKMSIASSMDISTNTCVQKCNSIDIANVDYDSSTLYEKKMSIASSIDSSTGSCGNVTLCPKNNTIDGSNIVCDPTLHDSKMSISSYMNSSESSCGNVTLRPQNNSMDITKVANGSTLYEKKMSIASPIKSSTSICGNETVCQKNNSRDVTSVEQDSTLVEKRSNISSYMDSTPVSCANVTLGLKNNSINVTSVEEDSTLLEKQSNISSSMDSTTVSCGNVTLGNFNISEQSFANDTLYGAFHDSTISGSGETLMHNIEALNDCIQKVDKESEECRRRLDDEIAELFKYYRFITSKENNYEFAIKIFGLRHGLWLWFRINPETYPNQKIRLKFAVDKRDRHLYPFPEYAEAVYRSTQEGSAGYLTRVVINAQKFRRFLRAIGYHKTIIE